MAAREDAIVALGMMGEAALPASGDLSQVVASGEEPLPGIAALALAEIAGKSTGAMALEPQLREDFPSQSLIWAAGHLGNAAQVLTDRLTSFVANGPHSSEAAWALGRIGPAAREAAPVILRYFGELHAYEAARAIARIEDPASLDALVEMVESGAADWPDVAHALLDVQGKSGRDVQRIVPAIGRMLLGDDPLGSPFRAAYWLRKLGPEGALPVVADLIAACHEGQPTLRAYAIETLAAIAPRDARTAPLLKDLQSDPHDEVREAATAALEGIHRGD